MYSKIKISLDGYNFAFIFFLNFHKSWRSKRIEQNFVEQEDYWSLQC